MERGSSGLMSAARAMFGTVGRVAVLVLAAGALGGASCSVRSGCDGDDDDFFDDDDDGFDDDDDDCDDDDDGFFAAAGDRRHGQPVDWTLREFQQIESHDPDAAPIAGLIAIKGFSLSSKLGPGVFGDPQIRLFTQQLLDKNPSLFALPDGVGALRFDTIQHEQHFILARWVQERPGDDGVARIVPGAVVTFVLDLHGKLVEVQNLTKIR